MEVGTAERMSRQVGVVTLVVGGVLTLFPERAGTLAGLQDPVENRVIGASDLVLVPGLLIGRPRWPWMAARAALNLAIASRLLRGGSLSGRAGAAMLGVATVVDSTAAATLRSAGV